MESLILEALKYYGMTEIPGSQTNPAITKMLTDVGYPFKDDETSWCGTFISYICKSKSIPHPDKGFQARQWLNWGVEVPVPKPGDVVVFWRTKPDSWEGHVALYVNQIGSFIYVLGGNQSNQVNIAAYPTSRLLGYRRYILSP